MKSTLSPVFRTSHRLLALLVWVATSAFIPTAAQATIYYWDTNAAAGFTSVTGSWDGTNTFWNTDSTGATTGTFVAAPTSADDLNVSAGTAGTITISGTGTGSSLTFSDNVANIVTGGTLALGGTGTSSGLFVTSAVTAATTVSSALTLNNATTTIQNAGTGVLTVSGGITGSQNLILNNNGATGAGITISTGSLNNTGTVTNSSTSTGGVTISSVIGTNVTGIIQNSSTGALTISNAANTSTGSVTINAGTLTLSGASNTFASYTLQGGTFSIGNATAVGSGALTLRSGVLNAGVASISSFTTNNQAITMDGVIQQQGNALGLGTGTVTLTSNGGIVTNTSNALTIGGNVTGSGYSFTKSGIFNSTGALIMSGSANAYTGGTNVFFGELRMSSVPTTGSIRIQDTAPNVATPASTLTLAFNPTLQSDMNTIIGNVTSTSTGVLGVGASINKNISFANLSNLSLGATTAQTYSGTLTPYNQTYQVGGGGNTLTISSALTDVNSVTTNLIMDPVTAGSSPGNVTLSTANTYTGGTRVNTGTLTLTGSLSSSTPLTVNNNGTFAYAPSTVASTQNINGLTVGSGLNSVTTANASNVLNLGSVTRGSSNGLVSFTPTGTINTTTANTNGILGTWAVTGSGTTLQYVTGAGNIASYSGATAATAADLSNMSSATTNYSAAAAATLVGNETGNTLRYTGAAATIALSANTLTLNGLMNAGSGLLTITNSSGNGLVTGANGVLDLVSNTQGITISAPITGGGAVTYGGPSAGTLTLSGTNTFSGGFTLNGGTVFIGSNSALGSGTLTLNGGTLTNVSTVAASLANNVVSTAGTASTIFSTQGGGSVTLTGALTGGGTLNIGAGGTNNTTTALNGDNSGFTGTFIYNSNGGSGNQFTLGGGTAASNNLSQATLLGISNGTRRFSVASGTAQIGAMGGWFQMIGSNTFQVGALSTDTTWTGSTAGGTTAGFVKVGTGTLTFSGTFSASAAAGTGGTGFGSITVNGGTLVDDFTNMTVGSTNQLASTGLTLQGGTLKVIGKAGVATSQAFTGTTINAGASSIAVAQSGGGTAASLATLAGITRTTTLGTSGGGTVDFVLPTGTQSSTNGITTTSTANVLGGIMTQANVNSVAYATVNQTDWAALSTNNIVALSSYTTGSLANNVDVTTSFTGAASAAPNSLRFNTDGQTLTLGTGTQVVTGGILVTANSNSTGSTITGNTLTTGGGREFVFIDYGKLTVASQLVNNAGGSTMLTKSGTGTLLLTNTNNTYSGINYLNDGVLNIAAAASLGTSTAANAISFNGGTLQLASAFDLGGTQGINLGFKGGTFDTNGFASTYSGAIASSAAVMGTTAENTAGQFGFTKAGAGTLTLTGTNTYAGATTITGGKLSVSYLDNATTAGNVTPTSAGGIGKSSNYAKNLVLNGGTLQYTGATASTDRLFTLGDNGGGLEASGSGAVNFTNTGAVGYQINSTGAATNSSPVLTLGGTNTGANTLAASIGNNGLGTTSLTKSGAGTWVLSGANTYTGTTTVTAGTLALGANNVFGATNFALGGGTLALGTFSNSKVGTLSLTANSTITLGSGGVFAFADSSALSWGSNTLSITGTFVDGASIRFGTSSGGLTGTQLSLISINGGAASIDTSGFLVSAVPEPATYAVLAGLGALVLAAYRRRTT